MNNTTKKVATRKGINYYREIFAAGNISKAVSVLPEVIKKYGYKRWDKYSNGNDILRVKKYTEFNWNHRIESFFLTNKGKLCVDIYWQGDSTDGDTSELASKVMYGYTIRGEYFFDGERTRETHSDIRISREEFADAIKAIAKYLAPAEVKARKEADRKAELSTKVFNYLDAKKKGLERWEFEDFWNGRIAVQKLLEKEPTLLNKTWDELKPIVEEVFEKNNKSDYTLRGGYYNGEKKYNLSYTKVG